MATKTKKATAKRPAASKPTTITLTITITITPGDGGTATVTTGQPHALGMAGEADNRNK
jgi:hypothetical protein